MIATSFIKKAALAAALVLAASSVYAQQTKTVEFGQTKVSLASSFVSDLESKGVKPGVVDPTHLKNGVVNFPVTGGAIDLDSAAGQIIHSGGLTLSVPGKNLRLQSFIIDTTGSAPVLTGLVDLNGKLLGRLPLFKLQLPAGVTLPLKPEEGLLKLKGVNVTLTKTAADALNGIFSVSVFHEGYEIGTANVYAHLQGACEWGWDCNND
jgi:hypothetical protein